MTINLNGVEFYSAQEVEARIREAIAGKDEKVDMENLPIGTLVKVVGNRARHEHEVGEILPITEVDEGDLRELYKLDGRSIGWVAVEDIEFVSFPEEEDSTSGDGDEGFEVGDTVKVLRNTTEGFVEGTIGKVVEIMPWGSLMIESDYGGTYSHPGSALELVEESEEDSDKYPAVGTKVKALSNCVNRTKGKVYEVVRIDESSAYPIKVTDDTGTNGYKLESDTSNTFEDFFEILEPLGQDANGEDLYKDESEIKAGDIVIAMEDELDITEGVEYEIKEFETGMRYFLDDGGDVRHVNVHEEYLRKKSDKRVFKKGDIVYVNEEITDNFGDSIRHGVLTEIIEAEINRGVRNPDGRAVLVKGGELDKLTLICRAEDRLDI